MAYLSPAEMTRIALTRPELRAVALPFEQAVEDQTGCQVTIVSGQRSYDEQAALYANCQTNNTNCPAAPPGQSKHEFGSAMDIRLKPLDGSTVTDDDYRQMADIAQGTFGLTAGYYFTNKDRGHVELSDSLAACQAAYAIVDQDRRDSATSALVTAGIGLAVFAFAKAAST